MKTNANDFIHRKLHTKPSAEMDTLYKKGILKSTKENIAKADDWILVVSETAGDVKYGRFMYSPSLDLLRSQTMGEFYGGGIVD